MVGGRWSSFPRGWVETRSRLSGDGVVLGIGRDRMMDDAEGNAALNLWTPRVRKKPSAVKLALVERHFIGHLEFLIPDATERERFLHWLAHCEKKPQQLPHHGYLLYTPTFGIGRNWLSSVLTRLWRGEVAASVNRPGLIESGFNDRFDGKRLAVVDEVHMSDSGRLRYVVGARLRQLMTEEYRMINIKFGVQYMEWNTVRWLLFSNHVDAIPLEQGDRRFAVIACPTVCRAPEYYAELYSMLADAEFIEAVGWWLADLDISKFNPGAKPTDNAAKLAVINATTPELDREIAAVLKDWDAPVAVASDLMRACDVDSGDGKATAAFGSSMRRLGHHAYGSRPRIGGQRASVWVLSGRESPPPDRIAEVVATYRKAAWYGEVNSNAF